MRKWSGLWPYEADISLFLFLINFQCVRQPKEDISSFKHVTIEYYLYIELKPVNPDSQQIVTTASAVLPAIVQNNLS